MEFGEVGLIWLFDMNSPVYCGAGPTRRPLKTPEVFAVQD